MDHQQRLGFARGGRDEPALAARVADLKQPGWVGPVVSPVGARAGTRSCPGSFAAYVLGPGEGRLEALGATPEDALDHLRECLELYTRR